MTATKTMTGFAAFGDDTFMRVSGFVPRLQPGCYKVMSTMSGLAFVRQNPTTDNLIFFEDSRSTAIVEEIRRFLALKSEYERYNIVHKRGFLMYGPPGTGKTSLLFQVSVEIAANDGITLFLGGGSDPNNIVEAINIIRATEPERQVLVIMEDIEVLYRRYATELLEMLDGGAVSGVTFIGTTNYINELDSRVRDRPSRFDIVVEIKGPDHRTRTEYLVRKGVDRLVAEAISVKADGLSFAHLKEFLVGHVILGKSIDSIVAQLKSQSSVLGDDIIHDGETPTSVDAARAAEIDEEDDYWQPGDDEEIILPSCT